MDDFLDLDIHFTYTVSPRPTPLKADVASVIQIHESFLVRLNSIPASLIKDGKPDFEVLWQAEKAFLDDVRAQKGDVDLVRWEARLGGPSGQLLSVFNVLI
jgi:hypothetical protein